MLRAWSVPTNSNGEAFFNMPELSADDTENHQRVEWWNAKLKEVAPDADLKVVGGGETEYKLNDKPGFLGF